MHPYVQIDVFDHIYLIVILLLFEAKALIDFCGGCYISFGSLTSAHIKDFQYLGFWPGH